MFSRCMFIFLFALSLVYPSLAALPPQPACGIQTIQPSLRSSLNKIINGKESVANSWPWAVSLRKYEPSTQRVSDHFCGGTLVYEDLVLTAAHCVSSLDASSLAVVVGIHNILTETPNVDNTFFVAHRYYHEQYKGSNIQSGNDIAILVLAKNVTLGQAIAVACLPSSSDSANVNNRETIATGWGSTTGQKSTQSLSDTLQQASLTVINGADICGSDYNSDYIYCTLNVAADNSNVCFGDSGGSIAFLANSKWYIYGITSYVLALNGKCVNTLPSYFIKVPVYLNWTEYGLNFTKSGQVQPSNSNKTVNCIMIVYSLIFLTILTFFQY